MITWFKRPAVVARSVSHEYTFKGVIVLQPNGELWANEVFASEKQARGVVEHDQQLDWEICADEGMRIVPVLITALRQAS